MTKYLFSLSVWLLTSWFTSLTGGPVVRINPGESFQVANDSQPAGTVFRVGSGVHSGQRVVNPKPGNQWIGEGGAILDGGESLKDAFHGAAVDVKLSKLVFRHYRENAVHFTSGSGVRIDHVTIEDTGDGAGKGDTNGSIRFENSSDLSVTNCHFERVSSGVLPSHCKGPVVIESNTGINTGRNFVQLNQVRGPGIRVNYNSMERVGSYLRPGAHDVEDWISVYKSHGVSGDPIQINYNRARGHGPSESGSFIMLGDGGGSYQQAIGNVGVTPGQVGIGLSGGTYIQVSDNLLFSESWEASNVALYSWNWDNAAPAAHHTITGNRVYWINQQGQLNSFWNGVVDGTPTVSDQTVAQNEFPERSGEVEKPLNEGIWQQWEAVHGNRN